MSPIKTPVALIISTGRQDIKFWAPGQRDGRPYGLEIDKQRYRAVHEALTTDRCRLRIGLGECDVGQLSTTTLREALPTVKWDPVRGGDQASPPSQPKDTRPGNAPGGCRESDGDKIVYVDTDGRLLLRPAKVERLITALLTSDDLAVQRVLIFYSDRRQPTNDAFFYRCEPIRTGEIIGHWLAGPETFGIPWRGETAFTRQECGIRATNYLSGLEQLEAAPYSEDFPVLRPAVRIIDEAIRNLADGFQGRAIVSALGGMTQIKPMVLASAELHFPRRTFDYWETEAEGKHPITAVPPLNREQIQRDVVTAADRLGARAHALSRLSEGDILGAWGSVAHLDAIKTDRAWLDRVKDLAAFFRGAAPSEEICSAIGVNGHGTTDGAIMLLLRAFQVEAALQGDSEPDWRVPDALIATTALVDLALEMAVIRTLAAQGCAADAKTMSVPADQSQAIQLAVQSIVETDPKWEKAPAWFPDLFLEQQRVNTMAGAAAAWRLWLASLTGDAAAGVLATALQNLEHYTRKRKIRHYRNQLAHRSLKDPRKPLAEAARPWTPNGETTALGPLWQRLTPSGEPLSSGMGEVFLSRRDAGYPAPPAQSRTCSFPASGSSVVLTFARTFTVARYKAQLLL
ncbi:hypothetical protein, partial [uncultured Thiodictyon sp.]